jgi:hypothetical protein
MGLDQYLYATKYVSGSSWNGADDKKVYEKVAKAMGVTHLTELLSSAIPSAEVTVKIAQWRKANQIHNWFVQNVQHGEDDCRKYSVDKAQLKELLNVCTTVATARDNALSEELLPTTSGFFFGNTDFDEYYYDDVEYTRLALEQILNDQELMSDKGWGWEFSYQSSW